jgi:hypothetical protein
METLGRKVPWWRSDYQQKRPAVGEHQRAPGFVNHLADGAGSAFFRRHGRVIGPVHRQLPNRPVVAAPGLFVPIAFSLTLGSRGFPLKVSLGLTGRAGFYDKSF